MFYDGECRLCLALVRRWECALARRHFRLAPLQADWVRETLGADGEELLREMRVRTPEGEVLGGAAGVVELARHFWWASWLRGVARFAAGRRLLDAGYRWVAARRHCAGDACAVPAVRDISPRLIWFDVLPLLLLPILVAVAAWPAPAWLFMWSMAGALFLGLKWLAWREAAMPGGFGRSLAFFFLWPGMDARTFCRLESRNSLPQKTEWLAAIAKTALGGAMIWGLARMAFAVHPLLAGWVGMIGLALGVHCGAFHLLSLAWRAIGVDATPIMNSPLRSAALAEFWGRRWNLGFSMPARTMLARPLAGRIGGAGAMFIVFLVSGLVHELVISLPARAGFGLPTVYFALQGLAVLFERSAVGRRLGLGAGWRGWLLTILVTAGPAFWLFHPTFVHRVILPLLQFVGAL